MNRRGHDKWLKNKKSLRPQSAHGATAEEMVYIQKNLTEANRKMFFEARDKAKSLGYCFIWHDNACTYITKSEGDRAIKILNLSDISRIVQEVWLKGKPTYIDEWTQSLSRDNENQAYFDARKY